MTLRFKDPVIRQFAFICYVKVDSVYNKDTIESSIRNTLATYFLSIDQTKLFIAKSELISLITSNNENIKAQKGTLLSYFGGVLWIVFIFVFATMFNMVGANFKIWIHNCSRRTQNRFVWTSCS